MSAEVAATATTPTRRAVKRKFSSVGGTMDGIESFWGIELTGAKPEEQWCFGKIEDEEKDKDDKEDKDSEPDYDFMTHTLELKMATLGKGCEKGAEQIVSVETKDKDGKTITTPLVNMQAGVLATIPLDLVFNDDHKVIFRLTEGTGPVYLSGTCLQEYPLEHQAGDESMFTADDSTATDEDDEDVEDEEDDDLEDEEDDEDEESDEEEEMETEKSGKKGKGAGVKRKAAGAKASKAKQRSKVETKAEESDEESEEDDDEEEKKPTKKAKSPKSAAKSPKGRPAKSPAAKGDKKKKQKKVK